ncbi:MAG: energy-coupling factor ABC transporter permease [Bacillota bacterium]
MHIPDGFLDLKTIVATGVASAGALSYSIKKSKEELNERQLPALGIMSAFIFAGQMINFPVAGGTSGHLLGAALATVLLGPWSASLVLATVLIVQALFFQDGGITALGAGIFNMAVVAVFIAHVAYTLAGKLRVNEYAACFVAAWLSVMAASTATALELAISGTVPLAAALPAMTSVHALIGVGEGIITAVAVMFVKGFNKSNIARDASLQRGD